MQKENMMIELIKECYKKQKNISIYNDKEDTCQHFTGYIGAYDDRGILIQHISPRGLYDGYIIIHRDTIYQINCGGKYENKIETLYQIKGQMHEPIEIGDNGILYTILEFAQKKDYIICVELQDRMIKDLLKNMMKIQYALM